MARTTQEHPRTLRMHQRLPHRLQPLLLMAGWKRFSSGVAAAEAETFGGRKREEAGLLKAEDLVRSWKTLFHPRTASGNRSYALIGSLASIESALLDYAFDHLLLLLPNINSFNAVEVLDVLPISTTRACGVDSREEVADMNTMQYLLENRPGLCLSGTAEMGIAHTLRGRVFEATQLPAFFLARSRCYRPEVSQSAAEAGLYRVHEFNKIEMFAVCAAHQSEEVLERIVAVQREIFSGLGLHCRLTNMPADDLGLAASVKFDIEAWMPGRALWGEVSSASNCTDYQAQRLNIRYKDSSDGLLQYAHTCNGTALASTRALIALLETHQARLKGFNPPEVLKRWLPGQRSPLLVVRNSPAHQYDFS